MKKISQLTTTKTRNIIFSAVLIAVWGVLAAVNLFKPDTGFSENENRYLASPPAFSVDWLLDGTYMSKADTYLSDQFVLRDEWISVMSTTEYMLGKRDSNRVFIGDNALFTIITPDEEVAEANADGVARFASGSNLDCCFALIPSAAAVMPEKLPPFAQTADEAGLTERLYESVGGKASTVPLLQTLCVHKDEYIYYRTDHHWTTYGAYLAYREICAVMGLTPCDYDAQTVSESFNGTLYSRSGSRLIDSDTMEAAVCNGATLSIISAEGITEHDGVYYPEYLEKKDKYSYFLGQNEPLVTISGGNADGGRLLLFRDSYAACLAPFLLSNYREITLADLRYINTELSELIDTESYDKALFLYSTDVFSSQAVTSKLMRTEE